MLCISGFVDDAMFARSQPRKGDANRVYILQVTDHGVAPGTKSDVRDRLVFNAMIMRHDIDFEK